MWYDDLCDVTEALKRTIDKIEKYANRNELRDCPDDEKFFCRVVALEYADRDIQEKCYCISNSQKYSHEQDALKLKCEEKYYRKMKEHPGKTLKAVGEVEITQTVTIETRIDRYFYYRAR